MTSQARNRLFAVVALLIAGAGLAYIALGDLEENLVYYWSPGELLAQGEKGYGPTVRLGGVVKPGTIQFDSGSHELAFQLADSHAAEASAVKVHSREVPPQMFRDGIGVVVEGSYSSNGVFESNRLMVNHSNEYRAPKEGEDPKQWQESLKGDTTTTSARTR